MTLKKTDRVLEMNYAETQSYHTLQAEIGMQ